MRAAVRWWLRVVARWLNIPENQLLPDADAAPVPPQQPAPVQQQPAPLEAGDGEPAAAAAAGPAGGEPPDAPDVGAEGVDGGAAAGEGIAVAGLEQQPGAAPVADPSPGELVHVWGFMGLKHRH